MTYNSSRALQLLRLGSGLKDATFRDGQEEAIRHIVEGRGRLLVVQRTGWGKSFVYFIAARLLREQGHGPTLLISPLLSLMRNQLVAAQRMGVKADTIHSGNPEEWDDVERAIKSNDLDILLISPERLANERFRAQVLSRVAARIALLVIDEAHCISDWGHDFRPHYRLLGRMTRGLPPNLRLLATTATANDRVMDDLKVVLGPHLEVLRGDLNRPSLLLQTIRLSTQEERMDGRLVLLSPYDPQAGFNIGNAMQRNKLIYALADAALVVQADYGKGGTWAGAIEQLEKLRLVPVYTLPNDQPDTALESLGKKGALTWPNPATPEDFNDALVAWINRTEQFSFPTDNGDQSDKINDETKLLETSSEPDSSTITPAEQLFAMVRTFLERLDTPKTDKEIANGLNVKPVQAREWIKRLVKEGTLQKLSKPTRYCPTKNSKLF